MNNDSFVKIYNPCLNDTPVNKH